MIVDTKKLSFLKIEKTLGSLEEKILFLTNKRSSSRDILKKIKNKKYAYTTIMTVMDRLYKKGFLKRKKIKKTYYYTTAINIKKIKQLSIINLILQLNLFVSPLKFLFYFLLIQTLILVNKIWFLLLKETLLKTIFISMTVITLLNFVMKLYLNGAFEFINLFLINSQLLFDLSLLNETVPFFELFILTLLVFVSWKLINSSKKHTSLSSYYQFKDFNL